MVERQLPKLKVAGSKPVFRSILLRSSRRFSRKTGNQVGHFDGPSLVGKTAQSMVAARPPTATLSVAPGEIWGLFLQFTGPGLVPRYRAPLAGRIPAPEDLKLLHLGKQNAPPSCRAPPRGLLGTALKNPPPENRDAKRRMSAAPKPWRFCRARHQKTTQLLERKPRVETPG